MIIRHVDGRAVEQPRGWVHQGAELVCLACVRDRDAAAVRQRIEDELRLNPEARLAEIAARAGGGVAEAAEIRGRLLSERTRSPTKKPSPARDRAVSILRRDPDRPTASVAAEARVSESTVRAARRRL